MVFESSWYEYQHSNMPKYVRLYFCIRREIERGNMEPGCKLPSIRQVSKELGLSSTTVENAYNQLLVEGYIYSIPQKGYYAACLDTGLLTARSTMPEQQNIRDGITAGSNFTDTSLFPFTQWRKAYQKVLENVPHILLNEGDPQGEYELRRALADYVYQARGIRCSPGQIVIGSGVQTLLHIFCDIADGLFKPKVAFEEPGFTDVRPVFHKRGYSLYPALLGEQGLPVESLFDTEATVCYTSPSHQYPTGLVMPVQKRLELLKWADQVRGYILEDDYDSELRFEGRPVPSLYSLDNNRRVVYIGSFSTLLAPSIRISYMILPEELQLIYRNMCHEYRSTVSTAEQLTLSSFIRDGMLGRHLRKMRKKCSIRMKAFIEAASQYREYIKVYPADTGIFTLIEAASKTVFDTVFKNGIRMGLGLRHVWNNFFTFRYASIPEEKFALLLKELIGEYKF